MDLALQMVSWMSRTASIVLKSIAAMLGAIGARRLSDEVMDAALALMFYAELVKLVDRNRGDDAPLVSVG